MQIRLPTLPTNSFEGLASPRLRRRYNPVRASTIVRAIAALALATISVRAGIPEPDLVWYGKVLTTSGGVPVRVTSGLLVWQIEPLAGGPAVVVTNRLTNINDQFSFVLRVPCEAPEAGVSASSATITLTTPAITYRRSTASHFR